MDDLLRMSLAELGYLIAIRTGDIAAAAIAQSGAPQLRYDALVADLTRDPERRRLFTADELTALVNRIEGAGRRAAALRSGGWPEGYTRRLTPEEAQAFPGTASVDAAIYRWGIWYYADSNPTAEDPHGLEGAQFVADDEGDYIPVVML